MKGRLIVAYLLILAVIFLNGKVLAQPERMLYFPDSGRNYSSLDPGQELLQRNLLISNQASSYNVSFALSFDKESWSGFALGPRYSSIYSLKGEEGCFIRIPTFLKSSEKDVSEIVYFLIRGKCYSVYWNTALKRWDLVENACRAY